MNKQEFLKACHVAVACSLSQPNANQRYPVLEYYADIARKQYGLNTSEVSKYDDAKYGDGTIASFDGLVFDRFVLFVETGGRSGGNCWGGSSEPYYVHNAVRPVEIPAVTGLVSALGLSAISLPQVIKLMSMYTPISHVEIEYYGNNRQYEGIEVTFEKLWDALFGSN